MRLLLVEDEEDLAEAVQIGLRRAGYAVDHATTVAAAYERLTVNEYDMLLLDLMLPDGDGFEVCKAIRDGSMPVVGGRDLRVLMLTARGGLPDRVRGLDQGADDYLVKPFALDELLARVRAVLRRETRGSTAVLTHGPLRVDTAKHEVWYGERKVAISPKEFAVLEYLMTRPGHVVSTEDLLEHVWDENIDPFTQTVRVTVGTLRRKLGVEPPMIETVVGKGYRLKEV
ncbi:response regulator transcription factor [Kibdelosporangium aridum]|uniref:DNA-binding response regulator, OmpR family, contains REC and winged-helix (WHTH) domain n=1 Tax=Kibdelosporangium aridum TaxID=2030 RepID=A0A1W2AGF8_KIBAR|nr:response regulator transcription factor [Kibdelosporangium aridum]SMC59785.1 DNA-binding response regulator, OmpR family, contains REC and winged-helix (wHTH) domain [Kibdelosporangium aridum]